MTLSAISGAFRVSIVERRIVILCSIKSLECIIRAVWTIRVAPLRWFNARCAIRVAYIGLLQPKSDLKINEFTIWIVSLQCIGISKFLSRANMILCWANLLHKIASASDGKWFAAYDMAARDGHFHRSAFERRRMLKRNAKYPLTADRFTRWSVLRTLNVKSARARSPVINRFRFRKSF